jgi:hypothetical protein
MPNAPTRTLRDFTAWLFTIYWRINNLLVVGRGGRVDVQFPVSLLHLDLRVPVLDAAGLCDR